MRYHVRLQYFHTEGFFPSSLYLKRAVHVVASRYDDRKIEGSTIRLNQQLSRCFSSSIRVGGSQQIPSLVIGLRRGKN